MKAYVMEYENTNRKVVRTFKSKSAATLAAQKLMEQDGDIPTNFSIGETESLNTD